MRLESAAAILLDGDLGSRIRSLHPDLPKPMIPVAGRPFVEWVLRYFEGQGLSRFVVALGHLAEVAEAYLAGRDSTSQIATTREPTLLGTGGAVLVGQGAAPEADPLVVANADSLALAPLAPALALLEDDSVEGVVIAVEVPDTSRFGSLEVDAQGRLRRFVEKKPGRGPINAGTYLFRRRLLGGFPRREPLSLEKDALPALLEAGCDIRVSSTDAPFLDIGTPASLALAEAFIHQHLSRASA